MNLKFLSLAGILVFGASLQASTSYTLNISSAGTLTDGSYNVSPFTATINGTSVQLYCDDFNDSSSTHTDYNVYVTNIATTGTALTNYTRYGVNDAPGAGYPAGTALYEEMAWLATQSQNDGSGTNADNNDKAIQEAIWHLTNDTAGPDGTSPTNTSGYTGTAAGGANGTAQSYSQWITDAQNDYNKTVAGYTTLNLNNWYIVTGVPSAGCTIGSNGTTGCTAGTAGTGNTTQEFLAYYNGSLPTSNGGSSSTPEPASFLLIGSGLLGVAIFSRRRVLASQAK